MTTAKRLSTLEFRAEKIGFSAGHFTVYTATSRERLHGHNYRLIVKLTSIVDDNGITFDYALYNKKLLALCGQLDTYFLLPTKSPHLRIEESQDHYYAYFHDEKIPFLKKDVKLLPIVNTTLEELSQWFLDNLIADKKELDHFQIQKLVVKIYNGPAQAGQAKWCRE